MTEDNSFKKVKFTRQQIKVYLENALKDLRIAKQSSIPEVKFNYSYTALLKAGVALIGGIKEMKVRSVPGHHIKILEMMSKIMVDDSVFSIGNAMRMKRNTDLYEGGILVSEKESADYCKFVEKVTERVKNILRRKIGNNK